MREHKIEKVYTNNTRLFFRREYDADKKIETCRPVKLIQSWDDDGSSIPL